ncbi:TPA: hypothetical protein QDB28_004071 [Burkholderia vietnamiensis]|nr:hypothetical protein [Burkholderia vietnamiensis]
MDNDKIRSRMMKLLELAKRGVGGEKDNAQRFLDKMLKQHGMTLADLDDEAIAKHWHTFTYKTELEQKLLIQTACKVLQTGSITTSRRRGSRSLQIELTKAQALELELHYSIYRAELSRNIDRMFHAFCVTNRICGPTVRDANESPRRNRCRTMKSRQSGEWRRAWTPPPCTRRSSTTDEPGLAPGFL